MKIVVVSDTHMPRMAKRLPETLTKELRGADFILHAGDWTDPEVAQQLEKYAPVDGVTGNNDGHDIWRKFGWQKTLTFGEVKIGIVHGHGEGGRMGTEERAIAAFKDEDVDCIVYGHSHIPVLREIGGVLVFNPGSPTDKRKQPLYSFGLLEIDGRQIHASHIFYKDK